MFSRVEIPPEVVQAAETAHKGAPDAPMEAALKVALMAMFRAEHAVPCLDTQPCRKVFGEDRAQAEAAARKEGGVMEVRWVSLWQVQALD